jgi:hypothetical protein
MEQERKIALLVGAGAGAMVVIGSLLPWIIATAPLVGTISRSGVDLGSDGVALLIGGIAVAVALAVLAFAAVPTNTVQALTIVAPSRGS